MAADPRAAATACLNCGATLHGRFCSVCGQRALPPYPPLRELVADSWHELTGWDGRYARTVGLLFRAPGALTADVLAGRWARYVTPLRLYLLASVLYFLAAATVPDLLVKPRPAAMPGSKITIDLNDPNAGRALTPEQRASMLATVERAPRVFRPILRAAVSDPSHLRTRMRENMPRVAFVLVPAFAVITAVFYRRRPWSQHIVFALHVHSLFFIVMAAARTTHIAGNRSLAGAVGLAALVYFVAYALAAFHRVYREQWVWVIVKSLGIALLYLIAGVAALAASIYWATYV